MIEKICDEIGITSNELIIKSLQKENKRQKEIIDKAIEYINNHINQETFDGYMDSYELKKLLDILKEVE